MTTFLTGVTGFLGKQLASALLAEGEDLVVLARGRSVIEANRRVQEALFARRNGSMSPRVHVCLGSLEAPGLGLGPGDRDLILSRCEDFIHCGANVRFDLPLPMARAVNVGGTRGVLALARERERRGGLRRLHHVSTAFVAGNRTDLVGENELDARLGHKNSYEQSKFESETEVRRAFAELPITVYRPSIVVGNSSSGATSSFSAFYWPLKIFALGSWRTCPGRANTPVDLVPVDYVVRAMLHLGRSTDSVGRSFHLSAGAEGVVTIGEICNSLHRFFPHRKPVRFVNPDWWLRYVHPVLKRVGLGAKSAGCWRPANTTCRISPTIRASTITVRASSSPAAASRHRASSTMPSACSATASKATGDSAPSQSGATARRGDVFAHAPPAIRVVPEPQLQPPRDQKHDAISFEDFHFRDRGSQNG